MTITLDDLLAATAGTLNATPDAAARATRYRALVEDTNRTVREAADRMLTLDGTTASFEALKRRSRTDAAGSGGIGS